VYGRTRGLFGRELGGTEIQASLVPTDGIALAGSPEGRAWSRLRFAERVPAGRWIQLEYRVSLFAPLSRPIIRFRTPTDAIDVFMPAPFLGRQRWIGCVPENTSDVFVSFSSCEQTPFRIDYCAILPFARVAQFALSRSLHRTLAAACLWLGGEKEHARRRLELALWATDFRRYDQWRRENSRPVTTIDLPRLDWRNGCHVCFVLATSTGATEVAIRDTLDSLTRQIYPNWSIALISPRDASEQPPCYIQSRVRVFNSNDMLEKLYTNDSLAIAPLVAGDLVPDYAAAVLAEHVMAHPNVDAWYGDDDAQDASGCFVRPSLKPEWSPVANAFSAYVLPAVYLRPNALRASNMRVIGDVLDVDKILIAFSKTQSERVGHVRRLMLTTSAQSSARPDVSKSVRQGQRSRNASITTVVVPSKDNVDRLRACVASIGLNENGLFEIVIIDNGSIEQPTWDYYEALRADPRVRVVSAPGPFNFSKLCNRGASVAEGSILLFLNNDTRTDQRNWLKPLVDWATRPNVGAVGPKLLYPTRQLQHAGIVVGLGGLAAHIERDAAQHYQGYLGRFRHPHEVSAVTGACLAVAKAKFEEVRGFDEDRFPIELNDVDLCLRLRQAGWTTIFTPETVLIHEESATRGEQAASRYARERENFRERWGYLLGDDPTFHPALSLHSIQTRLQ
jgi:O-antigen biosynthesis protein